MFQAVQAPLLEMVAVAGLALGVAALVDHGAHDEGTVQRLVLHAPERPHALYLTAWSDGDVYITLHRREPHALTFQTRAFINDGCEWLATEQLVPTGEHRYAYTYSEEILSCEPNAKPAIRTPRTGWVEAIPVR